MERHYYAWNWTRGVCTDSDSGAPIGHLHVFNSKQERDAWTRAGEPYRTSPGFREACSASWQRYDGEPSVHTEPPRVAWISTEKAVKPCL